MEKSFLISAPAYFPRTCKLSSTPAFLSAAPAPSAPAFCQRHQPNSPHPSATLGHFRAPPQLDAASPRTSLAGAAGMLRQVAEGRGKGPSVAEGCGQHE